MKSGDLSDIKILYVEDEPSIREGLLRFLKRRSDNVEVACNGAEGVEVFKSYNPDIVITDIRMPVMDGLTMSEKLKEINPAIPIIITTGHNDEEFFLRSIDIGIDKYIKKPVKFSELTDVVLSLSSSVLHEKQMVEQVKFLRNVMDLNPNYLITTDGIKCSYINKSFLKYLSCSNKEEFWDKYSNICSLFADNEDAFYHNKSFSDWVTSFKTEDDRKTVVMIPYESEQSVESVFLLSVKSVPNSEEWLLSFTDVTNLDNERKAYLTMAQQDPLTSIYNRKKFFEELEKEVERYERYGQELTLIMFDVDFFKDVNDKYGHQTGDRVLIDITKIINSAIRKTDIFARYGGEEFVILMPGTNIEGAKDISGRLKDAIANYKFENCSQITCSFGVASFVKTDNSDSFVQKADVALYNAKESGRNTVKVFDKRDIICAE